MTLPSHRRPIPEVPATPGILVEVATGSFVGELVRFEGARVVLRDRRGRERSFANAPGAFLVDDRPVRLVPPAPRASRSEPGDGVRLTASGSLALPRTKARVARASRILVEGVHDAELVERVWGDDLRIEGVVVDVLHGADDLARVVAGFRPAADARLGILLDHLVPGSKEWRLAREVSGAHTLVTGHPFVDVWAAVRPEVIGIEAWPEVPREEPWKEGAATRLGFTDPQELWGRIRRSVRGWRDLDRALIGAVERLIDFVTEPRELPPPVA